MTHSFRADRDGFAGCGLRSDAMELLVVPALGACVVSLRSLRTGREWLWRPPDSAGLFANSAGDPFERSPLTGAVECAPTIAACTVSGVPLPDHGEAWSAAWSLDEAAFAEGRLETSVRMPVCGLEFFRAISVEGANARFVYRIRNPSSRYMAYLWAFHPLLVFEPGDEVHLPPEIPCVAVSARRGFPELDGQAAWNWPEPLPGLRLDRPAAEGTFAKVFADFSCNSEAWVDLRRGDERLEFRFDPSEVPYLGLWFTRGGWNGFSHLAIEPSNAMSDSLAGCPGDLLGPFAEKSWNFRMVLKEEASTQHRHG